jgi:hypothetical protein
MEEAVESENTTKSVSSGGVFLIISYQHKLTFTTVIWKEWRPVLRVAAKMKRFFTPFLALT